MKTYILPLLLALAAQALAVPDRINYQGRLLNSAGQPVSYTSVSVDFHLYTVNAGGTAFWNESWPALPISNGLFNVELGTFSALTPPAFAGDQLYLGVQVTGDAEMAPRQRLLTAPYAMKAGRLDAPLNFNATNVTFTGRVDFAGATITGLTLGTVNAPLNLTHSTAATTIFARNSSTGNAIYAESIGAPAIAGRSIANNNPAVSGFSDWWYGVEGQSNGNSTGGVRGIGSNGAGPTWGVQGETSNNFNPGSSAAVLGMHNGAAGPAGMPAGAGVFGSNDTALGWGGYFRATSNGRGVVGEGGLMGVYGLASSATSFGVYGFNSNTLGNSIGVFGKTSSTASGSAGVHGENLAVANIGSGVEGVNVSGNGIGVFGNNTNVTGGNSIGVYGRSVGSLGTGVRAENVGGGNGGVGLYANNPSPTGTGAWVQNTGGGEALRVSGGAKFGQGSVSFTAHVDFTGVTVTGLTMGVPNPLNLPGNSAAAIIYGANSGTGQGIRGDSTSGAGVYAVGLTGVAVNIVDPTGLGIGIGLIPGARGIEVSGSIGAGKNLVQVVQSQVANGGDGIYAFNSASASAAVAGASGDSTSPGPGVSTGVGVKGVGPVGVVGVGTVSGGIGVGGVASLPNTAGIYGSGQGGPTTVAIRGDNESGGYGVYASSATGTALVATGALAISSTGNVYFQAGSVTFKAHVDFSGATITGLTLGSVAAPLILSYAAAGATIDSTHSGAGGVALRADGTAVGVSATTSGPSGVGVYGLGRTTGVGVKGEVATPGGLSAGVWGINASAGGYGVRGQNTTSGVGVQGDAGVNGIGVQGTGTGSSGVGVVGLQNSGGNASSAISASNVGAANTGYGILASNSSATGFGLWAQNTITGGSALRVSGNARFAQGSVTFTSHVDFSGATITGLTLGSVSAPLGLTSTSVSPALFARNDSGGYAIQARGNQNVPVVYAQTFSSPGTAVEGTNSVASNTGTGLKGTNLGGLASSFGVYGSNSGSGYGVAGDSSSGVGVYGGTFNPSGYGVQGYNQSGAATGAGVYGSTGASSGTGVKGDGGVYGVQGISPEAAGQGVRGEHTGAGAGIGVYGVSGSGSGIGVSGSGYTGVYGISSNYRGVHGESVSGIGVYGNSGSAPGVMGVSSGGIGIIGETNSPGQYGVHGTHNALGGNGAGVYGNTGSGSGTGVFGQGGIYGVRGLAGDPAGYGVYGQQNQSGSTGYGVYGENSGSPNFGAGVYGRDIDTSGMGVYGVGGLAGVKGETTYTGGHGVFGLNLASAGAGVGVYGSSTAPGGFGVEGFLSSGANTGAGVYGRNNSPTGYGVQAENGGGGVALFAQGTTAIWAQGSVGVNVATPNSSLQVNGSMAVGARTVGSGTTTLLSSDCVVLVNNGALTGDVYLPNPNGIAGRLITIKRLGAGINHVYVHPSLSEQIDNAGPGIAYDIAVVNQGITVMSDGNNWFIVGNF